MKTFKYTSDKMDLKTLKRKRLEIFDNFIFGKITYDQYVEQGKRLKEEFVLHAFYQTLLNQD